MPNSDEQQEAGNFEDLRDALHPDAEADDLEPAGAQSDDREGPLGRMTGAARERLGQLGEGLASAAEKARHAAGRTTEGIQHGYETARDSLAHGYERTREGLRNTYDYGRGSLGRAIEDHPLAVGAAALGIGLIAGLCIPRSKREDRWIGEQADGLKRMARTGGARMWERGKEMAQSSASAVVEEVRKQGHELVEQAQEAAGQVKSVAEQASRDLAESLQSSSETEGKSESSGKSESHGKGEGSRHPKQDKKH